MGVFKDRADANRELLAARLALVDPGSDWIGRSRLGRQLVGSRRLAMRANRSGRPETGFKELAGLGLVSEKLAQGRQVQACVFHRFPPPVLSYLNKVGQHWG